jgi:predicted peroxiredoxin
MSDERKIGETQGMEQKGKRDFVKTIGAGLGIAGLATLMGGQAIAADEGKRRYIVVATHGGNDPNRAILALLAAFTALDKGFGSVHFWMTLDGADLANKTKAGKIVSPIFKSFGTAEELINKLKSKGATFGVCPPCAEYMGAGGNSKFDFVEKQGADWLLKNIPGAAVVWL